MYKVGGFNHSALLLLAVVGLVLAACAAPEDDGVELGVGPILCEPGQGATEDRSTCEVCPAGTFNDEAGGSGCQECPFGTFQDEVGSTECKACPEGTDTGGLTGATHVTDCEQVFGVSPGDRDITPTPPPPPPEDSSEESESEEFVIEGSYSGEYLAGLMVCPGGFERTLPPGIIEVEMFLLDNGNLRILGLFEVEEMIFTQTEPGHWQRVFQNELPDSAPTTTVTITIWRAWAGLFDGHIETVDSATGCVFNRDFTLRKIN